MKLETQLSHQPTPISVPTVKSGVEYPLLKPEYCCKPKGESYSAKKGIITYYEHYFKVPEKIQNTIFTHLIHIYKHTQYKSH